MRQEMPDIPAYWYCQNAEQVIRNDDQDDDVDDDDNDDYAQPLSLCQGRMEVSRWAVNNFVLNFAKLQIFQAKYSHFCKTVKLQKNRLSECCGLWEYFVCVFSGNSFAAFLLLYVSSILLVCRSSGYDWLYCQHSDFSVSVFVSPLR